MRRREFISLIGGAIAWPFVARADQTGAPMRVGFLGGASTLGGEALVACFRAGLRGIGWNEGKNIIIEYQWTEGISERYSQLGAELVRLKPDLIVATSTASGGKADLILT
jgi:putative ABC transport system substrate-binding protein